MKERRVRLLFLALALLYVIPFWTVRYLPMLDGPCHTYNAWILRQSTNVERYPLFQKYYEINWRPYPNWISQGTMALFMFAVPPLVAEKLLVSGCGLLFLSGVWYLVGAVRPEERWLAFLAFPFVYHQLFQNGFYNFSISVALFLFVVGCWWRNHAQPSFAFAVRINSLLWLCYFSHILSFVLALAAIGVLWLATLRRADWRRHLLHIAVLLPQLVLPLWFFSTQGGGENPSRMTLLRAVRYFSDLRVLITFSELQRWGARALAVLFLVLLVLTFWREIRRRTFFRAETAFLLLALLGFVLFWLSPAGMAGGGFLKARLSLYPYLMLIPWFSPGLGEKGMRLAAAVLTLAALVNLGALVHWYGIRGAEVERYLAGLESVRPHSRVLAVFFQRSRPTDVLGHAVGYQAIEKGLIDWDNYEAKTSFFPTRFRAEVVLPDLPNLARDPGSLRVGRNQDRVDAIYTWKMPQRSPLRRRLRRSYELTSRQGDGELWQKRELPAGAAL